MKIGKCGCTRVVAHIMCLSIEGRYANFTVHLNYRGANQEKYPKIIYFKCLCIIKSCCRLASEQVKMYKVKCWRVAESKRSDIVIISNLRANMTFNTFQSINQCGTFLPPRGSIPKFI